MNIRIFDLFSIGLGPSSSHTIGPMHAANRLIQTLKEENLFEKVAHISITLYGSLALTGKGHGTDRAIIMGLTGATPETVNPDKVIPTYESVESTLSLNFNDEKIITFDPKKDFHFEYDHVLLYHTNGMRFYAFDENKKLLLEDVYYSIGGGFIVSEEEIENPPEDWVTVPYPFATAKALWNHCRKNDLTIAEVILENEKCYESEETINQKCDHIIDVMFKCIERGRKSPGILPGGLELKRRAPELFKKLMQPDTSKNFSEYAQITNWIAMYALAVSEENAAGGRVVTAPTTGSAGVIPAVLQYFHTFCEESTPQKLREFLFTAGAIGILYKTEASISGAEVGCQGEVGVACSMAAGALTAVLGGTLEQIEKAAEIGMEHNLGLTCDPINGLVQIPCIERNAIAANKAVNIAQLSILESDDHKISLDKVILTMKETGKDMMSKYKETSQGGLAVNLTEC